MEQNLRDSAPVLHDLRRIGIHVMSIDLLYTERLDYRNAIPVLLEWLPKVENEAVKEAIVRALSVAWAKPLAASALIAEFPRAQGFALKWAIGNALAVVAGDSVFDDIVRLIRDPEHGRAREMLVVALGNMKDPRAADLAVALLADDSLAGYAAIAVGKLKDTRALPGLAPLLNDSDRWVRDRARTAIGRITRAEERRLAKEAKRTQK